MKNLNRLQSAALFVALGTGVALPITTNATLVAQWVASTYTLDTTTWTDSSGHNHDGVIVNGLPSTPSYGTPTPLGKTTLSIVSDQTSFGLNNPLTLGDFTIFAVMRPDPYVITTGNGKIVGSSHTIPGYWVNQGNQEYVTAAFGSDSGSAKLSASSFYILQMTALQAAQGSFYTNNVLDGHIAPLGALQTFDQMAIGPLGSVAEIRVYDTALTPSEQNTAYTELLGEYISVPEPSTFLLFGVGAVTVWQFRRRMKRS